MYGDKWVYLNDWVTFGGFSAGAGVSDYSGFSPFGESGLYVYGAVDASHGNYFASNLYGGHTPYRVQTGDCGSAALGNYLNFKGNAGLNGNNNCDNCNAYAFAWVQPPSGAGPQWGVGSDDGDRIWLNGTMIADNNTARGQTWDQTLDLNLRAYFFVAQGAIPHLRSARGKIVNMADEAAFEPWPRYVPHGVSNTGQGQLLVMVVLAPAP